jgi:hypothetical protein
MKPILLALPTRSLFNRTVDINPGRRSMLYDPSDLKVSKFVSLFVIAILSFSLWVAIFYFIFRLMRSVKFAI